MEVIKIPQFSFWHDENEIYKHLSLFIYLAYKLKHAHCTNGKHQGPVTILKEMSITKDIPNKEIATLYECLKYAAFAYKQPEHRFLKELSPNTLFSTGDLTRMEKQRSEIKRLTKQHTELMVSLMDCQERCWKSRDKMKQYVSMLECAQMSLPYHTDDERNYNARKYAIKELKKDVISRQKVHSKNVGDYHTVLTQEQETRQEMTEIANKLENNMLRRMRERILQSWTALCSASDPTKFSYILDPDHISKSLYDTTCKTYILITPANDISSSDFNVKIQRPRLQDSMYSYNDVTYSTYGDSFNRTTTLIEDAEDVPDYFLKLKKGDKVKLKLLSPDGRVGFGHYKQSKMSVKKWGFINMHSVLTDESESTLSIPNSL